MPSDYTDLVLRTARMLSQSLLGLAPLESAVGQGKLTLSNDLARVQALQGWLIKLELCDRQGNIINPQGFEVFVYQVQGAMWAYADAKASSPTVQLVMTTPNWFNPEKVRHTESVFRDLISSTATNLWIVNPFFSLDSPQVTNLLSLIAFRLQQSDTHIRLLLRKAAPGGRESVLPTLRKLCDLVPRHRLSRLNVYSLDARDGQDRQTFHAKVIIQDGIKAYIGSANWTDSSLVSSIELGVLVEGTFVREQLVPVIQTLVAHSEPILLETF